MKNCFLSFLSFSRTRLIVKHLQFKYLYKAIFLFIIILLSIQNVRSQEIQEIKITESFTNTPLEQFLNSLEKKYGIRFFYKAEWIKTVEVTGSFKTVPLVQVLNQTLKGTELSFKFFQNRSVFVFPKASESTSESGKDESKLLTIGDPINEGRYQRAKIRGRVVEGKTGAPLSGAVVYNSETKAGVATDSKGRYTIDLPTGEMHLRVSFMSFELQNEKIRLIQDGNADFELFEETHNLNEVTVISENSKATKAQMSMVKMSAITIKELPVLMGEADLIKSIVMMPGVQTIGEMSSGFNVRGGNTDQNLVLLNGPPVFNTTHLFGFLSMVNPDAIEEVTLFKGGIPASYGERISSVMDVQLKDGSDKSLRINGGIGLINSRLLIEGPFAKKKKSTFLIGGRSTYSDWLLKQTKNATFMNSVAHFYDLNGSANFVFNPKNHLKLTGYLSGDVFNLNSSSLYNYANSLGSLNWKLNLSEKLVSSLSLAYSKYNLKVDQKDPILTANDYTLSSNIQYGSLKYALSFYPNDKHRISTGFQGIGYWINPGKITPSTAISNVISSAMRPEQSAEMALFADDDFNLTDKLSFNIGLRYSYFMNYGPGMAYNYAPGFSKSVTTITDSTSYNSGATIKSYQGVEPRLAVKYNLENGGSLRLNYQRIHQYISQVSNTAVISPADYWKSADQNVAPLINDQIALGFFKNPANGKFETSVEVYYKKLQNILDYKNGAQLIMNKHIETDLLQANGYAYGFELLARKNTGRLNGWISYTYSRSFQKADGQYSDQKINKGAWYRSVYDKPNDFSAVMNYKISRRWRFSGNFVYSTGRPITLPEQKYMYDSYQVVVFSERNKYRMPSYNRLDISITLDENLRKRRMWKGSWTFSIYNVYGRSNPYSVFYRKGTMIQDSGQSSYQIYMMSIIGVPVPSITYNFKF